MSRQDDIEKLVFNYSRRLQKLKEQQSLSGMSADPKILIEIEDLETKIENLQTELSEIKDPVKSSPSPQTTVVRNKLGLAIAGTRITIYDVMDYLTNDWPPSLIQHWLKLTDKQMADVMAYIENNRARVEAEYQQVLKNSEEIRQYWEERNRERLAEIDAMSPPPEKEEVWARLQAWKTRLEQEC